MQQDSSFISPLPLVWLFLLLVLLLRTPLTVASLATSMHSTPATRPMPALGGVGEGSRGREGRRGGRRGGGWEGGRWEEGVASGMLSHESIHLFIIYFSNQIQMSEATTPRLLLLLLLPPRPFSPPSPPCTYP